MNPSPMSLPTPSTTRRIWTLCKGDRELACEIERQERGYEVRVYLRGQLYYSRVDAAPDAASTQAVNLKRVLLADGWIDR